jgi:hypothetical protein
MKTGIFKKLRLFLLLLLFITAFIIFSFCLTSCSDETSGADISISINQSAETDGEEKDINNNTAAQMFVPPDIFAGNSAQISESAKAQLKELQSFPSMYVSIAANDIHRTEWARGIRISLRGAGEELDFENARARVRGRGNATWGAMGEKRSFRIRFGARVAMVKRHIDIFLPKNSLGFDFFQHSCLQFTHFLICFRK